MSEKDVILYFCGAEAVHFFFYLASPLGSQYQRKPSE